MDTAKNIFRVIVMFVMGFMSYITIEVLYRGYSYALMGTLGGIVFILIDQINERYTWNVELPFQAILGGIYATLLELIYGLISKYQWGYTMWDYSDEWLNFMGIICPKFSLCWTLLSVLAVLCADFINYCIFRNTEKPYYMIFGKKYTPGIYWLV